MVENQYYTCFIYIFKNRKEKKVKKKETHNWGDFRTKLSADVFKKDIFCQSSLIKFIKETETSVIW